MNIEPEAFKKQKTPEEEEIKQWYVMRDLKPRNSKLPAYKLIEGLGLRCFTPKHWVVSEKKNGKRVKEYIPVIQDLLFIHEKRSVLDPIVESAEKLQYRYKRGAGQRALMTVPEKEMDHFINAVNSDNSPIYYSLSELTPDMIGKEIIVNGGLLDGYKGTLLKIQGSKKRRLIVKLNGYIAVAVEINPDYIQVL